MLHERGMIKWRPFDNFGSSEKLVAELILKRNVTKMPSLSDEDLDNINNKIIYYYETKEKVFLKYFYNGFIYELNGIINNINIYNKYLVLNNKKIYFNQITWIK